MEEPMNDYPCFTTEPPLHMMLRRRREELNLRQADVAESLNVTPEAVTLWEGGHRRMELSKIPRLARTLQIDPKELCIKALQEYHPAFFQTLFGPRAATPASISPAA
jgi:transcriptional regulator with XRE-family HTH domain